MNDTEAGPAQKPQPGKASTASNCSGCDGCQWQSFGVEPGNWCYMFEDAPESLPCSQHDKFEDTRRAMGALIKKRPEILQLLVHSIAFDPNGDGERDSD